MALVDYFLKIDGVPGESRDPSIRPRFMSCPLALANRKPVPWRLWWWWRRGQSADAGLSFHDECQQSVAEVVLGLRDWRAHCECNLTARKAGKDQQDYLIIKFSDLLVSFLPDEWRCACQFAAGRFDFAELCGD